MSLGDKIAELRRQKGWSQENLARRGRPLRRYPRNSLFRNLKQKMRRVVTRLIFIL